MNPSSIENKTTTQLHAMACSWAGTGLFLFYKAQGIPAPARQGPHQPVEPAACTTSGGAGSAIGAKGNIDPTAGPGFWYRPSFDWAVPDATGQAGNPRRIFAGLLQATCVMDNTNSDPVIVTNARRTRGTQMFVFRNVNGDLRLSREYFEIAWDPVSGKEYPQVTVTTGNPPVQQPPMSIPDYINAVNAGMIQLGAGNTGWPIPGFKTDPNCRWARTDALVPFEFLKDWKNGEWHHIAVAWADGAEDPGNTLKMWVDNRQDIQLKTRVLPSTLEPQEQGLFTRLNQYLGDNVDSLYLAGIGIERRARGRRRKFGYGDERPATSLPHRSGPRHH